MPPLTGYIARRLTIAVPTLLAISIILFSLLHLAPGGPLAMYAASAQADPPSSKRSSGGSGCVTRCRSSTANGSLG